MPKKKAAKGQKTTIPENSDITISVSVKTPDGSTHKDDILIANASGCISLAYLNSADAIFENVRLGLTEKYGAGHVRA